MVKKVLYHRYAWVLLPICLLSLNQLQIHVNHERRQLGSTETLLWPDNVSNNYTSKRQQKQQQQQQQHRNSNTPNKSRYSATKKILRPNNVRNNNIPNHQLRQQQQQRRNPTTPSKSRYAYAFLVAGCDPKHPEAYQGFLYNILVAKHLLREEGSKADVVLLLRMVNNKTSSLPRDDEQMLRDGGVVVRYLPPPTQEETFYSAMMAKFHVLNMTEYRRVLYMDADVMPTCNLDYIFRLSEGGGGGEKHHILRENMVVTWNFEPASGGFFMIEPKHGDLEQLERIVQEQRKSVQNNTFLWPPFDVTQGWGHEIQPDDPWATLKAGKGTLWNFTFAFADQGLLYHWVKYVKKSVSIVFGKRVRNWSIGKNGTLRLKRDIPNAFLPYACPPRRWSRKSSRNSLYEDFYHFTGPTKPWESQNVQDGIPQDVYNSSEAMTPIQLWYHILRKVKVELNLTIDIYNLKMKPPTLGRYPTFVQYANHVGQQQKQQQQHQQQRMKKKKTIKKKKV